MQMRNQSKSAEGFALIPIATDFVDVIWGSMPFVALMLAFTVALIFWPGLVTWLPNLLF